MPDDYYDLFLSHSKLDSHLVETLLDQLQTTLGYKVWFDRGEIAGGDLWFANISNGVRNSRAILFVGSINSYLSENCRDELTIARRENRKIITLLTDSAIQPSYLAFLAQTHQIKHAKNGNHLHELKKAVSPSSADKIPFPAAAFANPTPPVDPELIDRIADRLPRHVDRFSQKDRVEDVFRKQFTLPRLGDPTAPKGGPIVILAHGPECEAPEKLSEVLSGEFLDTVLKFTAGRRPRFSKPEQHELICPEDDFRQLKELRGKWLKRIANSLGGRLNPAIPDVVSKLELSPACHVFRFAYRTTCRSSGLKQLVSQFAGFWADPAWAMSPECRCVVFLSLIYPARKEKSRLVEKVARGMAKPFPEGRFVTLDPLASVSLQDALQWLQDPAVKDAIRQLKLSSTLIEQAIRATYGSRQRLSMQSIIENFRVFLTSRPDQ